MPGDLGSVLVIEKDHRTRVLVRRTLEACGVAVTSVSNGVAAAALLTRDAPPPQLVLLSPHLPLRGAGEVLAALRQMPGGATIPVIELADGSDPPLLEGACCLLRKPVDPRALLAAIRACRADPEAP